MSVEHVTQIETEDAMPEEGSPPSASNDDTAAPAPEDAPKKKQHKILYWIGTLVGSTFTGLTVTVVLGVISGLAIGILGTIYKVDYETMVVYGMSSGAISGAIAMVAAIIFGIRRTQKRRKLA